MTLTKTQAKSVSELLGLQSIIICGVDADGNDCVVNYGNSYMMERNSTYVGNKIRNYLELEEEPVDVGIERICGNCLHSADLMCGRKCVRKESPRYEKIVDSNDDACEYFYAAYNGEN